MLAATRINLTVGGGSEKGNASVPRPGTLAGGRPRADNKPVPRWQVIGERIAYAPGEDGCKPKREDDG